MSTQAASKARILELEDTKRLYQHKSTRELVFSFSILKFCSYEGLVRLSTRVFDKLRHTPLERPLLALVRPTFYKQFCSGSSIADSKPALDRMAKHGIGTILEYVVVSFVGVVSALMCDLPETLLDDQLSRLWSATPLRAQLPVA